LYILISIEQGVYDALSQRPDGDRQIGSIQCGKNFLHVCVKT